MLSYGLLTSKVETSPRGIAERNTMGWPAPADSKNAVKKAGDRIRKGQDSQADIDVLNRWRAAHGYIINTFQASLRTRTRNEHVPVAQRLKRGATIVDKLRQGRALDLSTMQDIAGVRLVFPDVTAMREFRAKFHQTKAKHELVNENDRYDYMLSPKVSGYRGINGGGGSEGSLDCRLKPSNLRVYDDPKVTKHACLLKSRPTHKNGRQLKK